MKVFKIRKKGTTNQFSSGGSDPRWTSKGKSWTSLGHVKTHLGMLLDYARPFSPVHYADAELVEFEMVEKSATDITVVGQQIKDARAAKRQKAEAARIKMIEENERKQLQEFQRKYPTKGG